MTSSMPPMADPGAFDLVTGLTDNVRTFDALLTLQLLRFEKTGNLNRLPAICRQAKIFSNLVTIANAAEMAVVQSQPTSDSNFNFADIAFRLAVQDFKQTLERAQTLAAAGQGLNALDAAHAASEIKQGLKFLGLLH